MESKFKRICINRLKLFRVPYHLRSYPHSDLRKMISIMHDECAETIEIGQVYVSYRELSDELIRRRKATWEC